MTYLQLVNAVLSRLREREVASVNQTDYSKLIGKYVNDAKRQVEDAWEWDALETTLTLTTVAGTYEYTLTGSGRRPRGADVNDSTNKAKLTNVPSKYITDQLQLTTTTNANPAYYAWTGTDGTDTKVLLHPTPDGAYSIKFNLYVPQADLSSDSTELTIQSETVIAGAYARAVAERGEDAGLSSSEAYGMFKQILADQIAIEASRQIENECWIAC